MEEGRVEIEEAFRVAVAAEEELKAVMLAGASPMLGKGLIVAITVVPDTRLFSEEGAFSTGMGTAATGLTIAELREGKAAASVVTVFEAVEAELAEADADEVRASGIEIVKAVATCTDGAAATDRGAAAAPATPSKKAAAGEVSAPAAAGTESAGSTTTLDAGMAMNFSVDTRGAETADTSVGCLACIDSRVAG